jgi:hypothetical protein
VKQDGEDGEGKRQQVLATRCPSQRHIGGVVKGDEREREQRGPNPKQAAALEEGNAHQEEEEVGSVEGHGRFVAQVAERPEVELSAHGPEEVTQGIRADKG